MQIIRLCGIDAVSLTLRSPAASACRAGVEILVKTKFCNKIYKRVDISLIRLIINKPLTCCKIEKKKIMPISFCLP